MIGVVLWCHITPRTGASLPFLFCFPFFLTSSFPVNTSLQRTIKKPEVDRRSCLEFYRHYYYNQKENPFDFSGLEQRFSDTFVTEPLLTFVMDADEKKKTQKDSFLHRKHAYKLCDLLTKIRHK